MTRSALLQACFGALLVLTLLRASVIFEPVPGWDGNPLQTVSAIVGLGPTSWLAIDASIALLGATICLSAGRRLGLPAMLALIGSAAVVAHTLLFAAGDAEPLPIAGAWASGAVAFAAASVAGFHPALRRVGIAVALGFLCILLAKGSGQLLIEHPSVVETFESDPEAALATRGFQQGSAAALQFERRLRQPDITGWFGLSNVLSAYLAAGAVASFALCVHRFGAARTWPWWVVAGLGSACAGGVIATGSKAGLVIAAAGCAVLVASFAASRFVGGHTAGRALPRLFGLGLWLLPVAAIVGRAALLPAEGELSLLFRSFYLHAAVDIAVGHLPAGTGIDSFRAAYTLAKPSIAPESVTSSHNAVADWLAMLGLFGVPLTLAVVAGVWQAAGSLVPSASVRRLATPTRSTVLCMALVLALPVVASATLESATALLELSIIRLLGLLLGVLVAVAAWRLRPSRMVAAAMALILLTHAQLDMLLFHPGSIPLALFLAGLAMPAAHPSRWKAWLGLLPLTCAGVLCLLCLRLWSWEAPLRRAFVAAQDVAITAERAERGSSAAQSELVSVAGQSVALIRVELEAAAEAMPSDPRAWLALCDVELLVAGPGPSAWRAAGAAVLAQQSTQTLSRAASVALAIAEQEPQADRGLWIERARDALTKAVTLDPQGPHLPAQLAELEARAGRLDDARFWASQALAKHESFRLDPLAGLPDGRVRRLEALIDDDAIDSPPGS